MLVVIIFQLLILFIFAFFTFLNREKDYFGHSVSYDFYSSSKGRQQRSLFLLLLLIVWIVTGGSLLRIGFGRNRLLSSIIYVFLPVVFAVYLRWRQKMITSRFTETKVKGKGESKLQRTLMFTWIEFAAILLNFSAIALILSNLPIIPSVVPYAWSIEDKIIVVGESRLLIPLLIVSWCTLHYILTLLAGFDIAKIQIIASDKKWGVRLFKQLSFARLIESFWTFIILFCWLRASVNPAASAAYFILASFFIAVVPITYSLISGWRYMKKITEGVSNKLVSRLLGIIRYRIAIIFIFNLLALLSFTGMLIRL